MPRGKKKVEDAVKAIEEKAVATEVEVKKTTRSTGRKAKAKVEEAVAQVAEKAADAAAAVEVEAKKTAGKAKRTVKKTEAKVEEAATKPTRKARAAKLDIVIQSVMGGAITPEEIAAKVPKDAVSAYVKVEENKIYWVDKKGETGDVEIWG